EAVSGAGGMKSPQTEGSETSLGIIESMMPRLLRVARGKPLETAVVNALTDAARTTTEINQRIDAKDITLHQAHTRLIDAHEARKTAVMRLPRHHPWMPMLSAFIANRGAALPHLLRERVDPARADMVRDGDRRMAAILRMSR